MATVFSTFQRHVHLRTALYTTFELIADRLVLGLRVAENRLPGAGCRGLTPGNAALLEWCAHWGDLNRLMCGTADHRLSLVLMVDLFSKVLGFGTEHRLHKLET